MKHEKWGLFASRNIEIFSKNVEQETEFKGIPFADIPAKFLDVKVIDFLDFYEAHYINYRFIKLLRNALHQFRIF